MMSRWLTRRRSPHFANRRRTLVDSVISRGRTPRSTSLATRARYELVFSAALLFRARRLFYRRRSSGRKSPAWGSNWCGAVCPILCSNSNCLAAGPKRAAERTSLVLVPQARQPGIAKGLQSADRAANSRRDWIRSSQIGRSVVPFRRNQVERTCETFDHFLGGLEQEHVRGQLPRGLDPHASNQSFDFRQLVRRHA